jgi:hypothetical protein
MSLAFFNDTIDWRNFSFGLEAKLLGGIALFDLLSTLYLMRAGVVVEANPILAPYAAVSPAAFVVAKVLLTIPQLVLLECIARRYPKIVRHYGRLGIAAYALVYVAGSLLINYH